MEQLLKVLREATKNLPELRYAWGLVGLSVASAIAVYLHGNGKAALITGSVALIGFVILLLVIPKDQDTDARTPRRFIVWSISIFFVIFLTFTVTAFAFSCPCNWVQFLNIDSKRCKVQTTEFILKNETKIKNSKEPKLKKNSKLTPENLKELDIGVNQVYIKQILGEPKKTKQLKVICNNKDLLIEYNTWFNNSNKIIALFEKKELKAFLIKNYQGSQYHHYYNYHGVSGFLGKSTFEDIGNKAQGGIFKFDAYPFFIEKHYFGKYGNYNRFYFSHDAGYLLEDMKSIDFNASYYKHYFFFEQSKDFIMKYRKKEIPHIVAIVGEEFYQCNQNNTKKEETKKNSYEAIELIYHLLTLPPNTVSEGV